jgi:4-amino-4-deoxy-L-arabinose transferase-like glycosyltransferase
LTSRRGSSPPLRTLLTSGLVFAIALAFGYLVSELNLSWVKHNNPQNARVNAASHVYGYTIWSVDNYWYLTQVENALAGRGFTLNPPDDPRMAVRRTPGYPLFWAVHRVLLGERGAFAAIRWTQLLLYALSAVLLGSAVRDLTGDPLAARAAALGWAVSPFAVIYAYYTITEALYPALTVIALAACGRALKTGRGKWHALAGLLSGALALTRPICGALVAALVFASLAACRENGRPWLRPWLARTVPFVAGVGLVLLPWVVHNWLVTGGDIVLLEAAYGRNINMGRAHTAFWMWITGWGYPSEQNYTHEVVAHLAGPRPEDATARAERFVETLPAYALAGASSEEVRGALLRLNTCLRLILEKREPEATQCDRVSEQEFMLLAERFRKASPLRYYVLTPMRHLRALVFQSFSSAYPALNPPGRRFTPSQLVIKGILYVLNVGLWLSMAILPFGTAPRPAKVLALTFVGVTLVYLLWIIRIIEARYALQLYPVMYMSLALLVVNLARRRGVAKARTAAEVRSTAPG